MIGLLLIVAYVAFGHGLLIGLAGDNRPSTLEFIFVLTLWPFLLLWLLSAHLGRFLSR